MNCKDFRGSTNHLPEGPWPISVAGFIVGRALRPGSTTLGCLLLAAVLASTAAAQGGPGPYTGTAWQVSSQRPRLLVHSGRGIGRGPTVSELQERRLSKNRPGWANLNSNRKGWEGLLTPALRALLLGDLERRADVVARLQNRNQVKSRSSGRQSGGHMAIAFDWLYETLSESERSTIAANIALAADGALLFLHTGEPDITHNFTYMALFTLLTSGLALSDVPGYEDNARHYLQEAQVWLEGRGGIYETCQALSGGWPEGIQYGYRENTRLLLLMMHALRTATDHDPFVRVRTRYGDFARQIGRSYMALTRPDMTLERLGDVNRNTPLLHDQHRFLIEALAEGLRHDGGDALVPGMLAHFSDLIHEAYGKRDTHGNFQWGMMLFAQPQAPRQISAYRNQPLLQVFGRGTLDLVVMRDGWNADGTFLTFVAGNHFVDHQHFDKGSLTLFHRGALLVDSGAYDGMYSEHHREYASRTLAHNAPLIFDAERPLPPKHSADGGQLVLRGHQHHASWMEYQNHLEREHLDAADLLVATAGVAAPLTPQVSEDASPGKQQDWRRFAVVQAELAGAYGGAVNSARRTVAFAPAARLILVHDVMDFSKPLRVSFLAHTQATPLAAATSERQNGIHELGEVPWWTWQRSGTLKLPASQYDNRGRLFMKTLAGQGHSARLIGGKGYQWIVGKRNVSPGSAGNLPRESGKWRIEVQSPVSAEHDFTHVFQIASAGQFEMAKAQELNAGAWSATHVQSAPEVVLLVAPVEATHSVAYRVDTALPSVHLLVGWPAAAVLRVDSNGNSQVLRADAEGVLAFEDSQIGPHQIVVSLSD